MLDTAHPLRPQLRALTQAHPTARIHVLVRHTLQGRALEDALLRTDGHLAGVSSAEPVQWARRIAQPDVLTSGRREVTSDDLPFVAAHLLDRLEASQRDRLPQHHRLASTVAQAIETLRRHAVPVAAVKAGQDAGSDTFAAIAGCYAAYHDLLETEHLYDGADVLTWATERVEAGTANVGDAVVAVCDDTECPERVRRFLAALRRESTAWYRLGTPSTSDAPPTTAAAQFADAERAPHDAKPKADEKTWAFQRSVGVREEVRGVFRSILEADLPLDAVEIAMADGRPYRSVIADASAHSELPATFATGRPAREMRSGRALSGFLEWIAEDFDVAVLIRLLRTGILDVRPVLDGPVEAHEIATVLAARRYEPRREGYRKALGRALEEVSETTAPHAEGGRAARSAATEKRRVEAAMKVTEALLDHAPRRATMPAFAETCRSFVRTFASAPPSHNDAQNAERSSAQDAHAPLLERLARLTRLPVASETPVRRLATQLREWLDQQYLGAQRPAPGAVHVVPLESAGYSGRSHLFVVGADSDTMSTAAIEDVMLRDADRQALSASLERMLPAQRSAADETAWRQREALRRHAGRVTLCSRVFDVERGEERHPSSLFLQLEAEQDASEAVDGLVPPSRPTLGDGDIWLHATRGVRTCETEQSALDARRQEHPGTAHGDEARAARAAEAYTSHDGLLAAGTYPELDVLHSATAGGPVSASRLETLAATPYVYFLRYVLGVRPLDEPALDDEPWMNRLRRGTVLHSTFDRFMRDLDGRMPTPEDEARLRRVLDDRLDEEAGKIAPPNDAVFEASRRQLWADARVFLRAEIDRADTHTPRHHELGFGLPPHRREEGDLDRPSLSIGDGTLLVRGRIDRVDVDANGQAVILDYKTGSTSTYDESDPLQDGKTLQWALYAAAYEHLTDTPVATSGYYFTSAREMGTQITFDPARHREALEQIIGELSALARSGSFPVTPDIANARPWKWGGYDRIVRDLRDRGRQLKAKTYPDDRPAPRILH